MNHQEKKYLVDSFAKIKKTLQELNTDKIGGKTTIHYYAKQKSNDVAKIVEYSDRIEIHILKEKKGKFDLVESISIKDLDEGLDWFKERGYKSIDIVKMTNEDHLYKDGRIRLYTIDDWLKSIILDYPEGEHDQIEKELRLGKLVQITVPYNKYLESINKVRSKSI